MSLRIIGGKYRGRRLHSLPGMATRPTPEIVREALFNILGDSVIDCRFLDLFAGTGAVGLEALSRGGERVTFVEQSTGAREVLKKNLALLHCAGSFRLISRDVYAYRDVGEENFIFAAPPYTEIERMERLGLHLGHLAAKGTLWILQHPKDYKISGIDEYWEVTDKRIYGRNALSFFSILK